MAHEVESMMYRGATPWHGLGTRVTEAPSITRALAMAGLDWTVELQPLYLQDGRKAPAKACVRTSDNRILDVVGPRWTPLQNIDALDWFEPLLDANLVELHTAGSLRGGQRVWALARILSSPLEIVPGDLVEKFILLSNSHDGTKAIRLGFTPVRVVCANTLRLAHGSGESRLIRVLHTAGASRTLQDLHAAMNLANQSFEATAEQYRALAQRRISKEDLRAYVKIVLGVDKEADAVLSARMLHRIDQIEENMLLGAGAGLAGMTYWGAYNAVTEHLSYQAGRGPNTRLDSLWFGANQTVNQRALDTAMQMALGA